MDALDYTTAAAEQQDAKVGVRGWFALATGVNLAFAVCSLTCKVPGPHALSWVSRLLTSLVDLGVACLVGAFGTWLVLGSARRHRRSLSLCGARGWVFLPAIVLFLQQESLWAPLLTIVSAALVTLYLSRFLLPVRDPEIARSQKAADEMFTGEITLAPASWIPFGLVCCLYGALLAAWAERTFFETVLLAAATLLLVLRLDAARKELDQGKGEECHRGSRPYVVLAIAFCCVWIALSAPSPGSYVPLLHWGRASFGPKVEKQPSPSDRSSGGYRTIVLWPIQRKEKIITAPFVKSGGSSPGITKPWSIPFDGPYWYFNFWAESAGANSRTAHGDPLKVNVHSTDDAPLLMEARQQLLRPLDLTCCREMQIVIRNDVSLGALAVGVSLTDSHAKGNRSQSLGVKAVASNSSGTSPVEQVLTFPFPEHRLIRSFDSITVSLLPDPKHRTAGRRVAVERFVLIPN